MIINFANIFLTLDALQLTRNNMEWPNENILIINHFTIYIYHGL